jgi:hypothetical protein
MSESTHLGGWVLEGSSSVGSPTPLVPHHVVLTELSVLVFHKLKGDKLHRTLEMMPTSTSGAQSLMILILRMC